MINKIKSMLCISLVSICIADLVNAQENDYSNLNNNHEIVAKYEHGGKGYEAIAKDSYGGYSYGKWQISTRRKDNQPSTFDYFLTYLKKNNNVYYEKLINAGGYESAFKGDPEFIAIWKKVSKETSFKLTYDNFILDTQIIPGYKRMEKEDSHAFNQIIDWGLNDKTIQAAIHSMIIQHGPIGSFKLIRKALTGYKLTTKEDFLKVVYETRKATYPKYIRRYNNEYRDLINSMCS